jgi:cell division protein FtsI/penicillin-binding protein 2
VLKDWLAGGHGSLNLVQGLSASCNIVFYTLGKALGERDLGALPAHAEAFGFGKPTGLGTLPEVAGQVPRPDSLGGSVNLAIGQGEFLGTPLQVANLFAALGRGGELQRPRLVAAIDGEGAPPLPPPGKTADLPISPAERSAVLAGLRGVLKPPFGSAASTFRGFRHDIAAKTGSAETGRPDLDYLWFAAWAPAEQPRYALAVVVEAVGLSSQVVAPIGRRLLEFLLG